MWLWDTNIIRAYSFRAADGHDRLLARGRAVGWASVGFPIAVVTELLDGRLSYLREAHRRTPDRLVAAFQHVVDTLDLVADFTIVPFDPHALAVYSRRHLFPGSMSRSDRLIASIALAGGHTLVTRNVADFASVSGLMIENWIDDPT